MTDLSYGELCGLKAKAAENFSMREIGINSLDDCGVKFENMKSLQLELMERKFKDPLNVRMKMDEIIDSDELRKTYVIPLTLPNGQEVTAIVDNDGRSMAVELKDEEGKSTNFILSDRLKEEILRNPKEIEKVLTSEGLANHLGLEQDFLPEDFDDFSKKIGDKSLIPTKEDVEEKENIKDEEYDKEKIGDKETQENEQEEEEVDLDEVAKTVGVSKDAIEKFMEAEGITDKNQIKGVKAVTDIEGLESMLGNKLPEQNSTVLVVKTKGEMNQDKGYIIDTDGNKLLGNEGKVNEVAEELVPEHACSETLTNVEDSERDDSQTIEYVNSNGQNMKQELNSKDGNTDIDMVKYAQSRLDALKLERDSALSSLNSGEFENQADYYTKIAEIQDNYKIGIGELQAETGVNLSEIYHEAEEKAEQSYEEAGVQEVKDDISELANGVIGITGRRIGRDERESNSHDEGRMPKGF